MERSVSSLTFTGSIPEAIAKAQKEKKLFVVYISGENPESVQLEKSTWTDLNVADCIAKYCVMLHFPEGSTDAAHLSAIYPQKLAPCITVIGYNGAQMWQNDGFMNAENLVSSIQKAWMSLHMQETAATVLTAALASRKDDASYSESSLSTSHDEGDCSTSKTSITSEEHGTSSEAAFPIPTEIVQENRAYELVAQDAVPSSNEEATVGATDRTELRSNHDERSEPLSDATREFQDPVPVNACSYEASGFPTDREFVAQSLPLVDNNPGGSEEVSQLMFQDKSDAAHGCKAVQKKDHGSGMVDNSATEVFLNIRLPDGASLQDKFPNTGSLRLVKDYVDKKSKDVYGPYELAIPYPRKVFKDQELDKSLLELGLTNRQALMVVPRQRALHQSGSGFSSGASITAIDTPKGEGGYFSYVKKVLSFMNPFSYLGATPNMSASEHESQSGLWQYSPNPVILKNSRRDDGSSSSQEPSSTRRDDANRKPISTSRIGSNIHTLKHDEDDAPFGDRNAFWNGNSTQYGGNDDGK